MKIVSDTLKVVWEVWEDPGDYPNSIAYSRLPNCLFPIVLGEIVFEAENENDFQEFDNITEWIWKHIDAKIDGLTCKSHIQENQCTIWFE